MSKYTTQLRYICEQLASAEGVNPDTATVREVCTAAAPKIFEDTFEDLGESVNVKILLHFYMREIAAETYGLWRLWLNDTVTNLWLYKYQRAFADWVNVNGLSGYSERRTVSTKGKDTKSGNNTARSSAETSNSTTSKEQSTTQDSDTPQGGLSDVISGKYLSAAQVVNRTGSLGGNSSTDSGTTANYSETGDRSESVTETRTGYNEPAVDLVTRFLSLPSVLDSLYNDLEPLFMQIW